MINPKDLYEFVIVPTLDNMSIRGRSMGGEAISVLVLGSIGMESNFGKYLQQLGGGPAAGIVQMERATFDDITERYFMKRPDISDQCQKYLAPVPSAFAQVRTNLAWAVSLMRIKYWMAPEKLPPADDLVALGSYWERHYNTVLGPASGDPAGFARRLRRVI